MATYKGVKIDYSKDIAKQIKDIDAKGSSAPKGGTTPTPPKGGSSGSGSSSGSSSSPKGTTTPAPVVTPTTTGKSTPGVAGTGYWSSTGWVQGGNSANDPEYKQLTSAGQTYGVGGNSNNGSSSSMGSTVTLPSLTGASVSSGSQVRTESVGGVQYKVTGDPIVDAANKAAAQKQAEQEKKAARDRERLQQDQKNAAQQQDITNQGLIQQLIALQKQQQIDVAPKINDLSYIKSRNSQQIANTLGSSGDEALQTGRAAIYQQQATSQEGVKQAEIDNILSNYQQRYGALGTGINATMPTQVSPGNSLVSPQTGSQIYNGINQAVGYNNLLANQGTGRDLGYQATSIANTISQADANVDLLLQSAGINMTRVTDINELLQIVNQHFGANSAEQVKFQAALEGSIGRLLESGLFTGDQVQQIKQQGVDKQTPAGMLDFYLAIKNQAINQYNQIVKQGQTYNTAGASSVIGSLQPMNTIKTGTNLQVSNTPKGATVNTLSGSINTDW